MAHPHGSTHLAQTWNTPTSCPTPMASTVLQPSEHLVFSAASTGVSPPRSPSGRWDADRRAHGEDHRRRSGRIRNRRDRRTDGSTDRRGSTGCVVCFFGGVKGCTFLLVLLESPFPRRDLEVMDFSFLLGRGGGGREFGSEERCVLA